MGALLEQYEDTQLTQNRRGELVEGTVVVVDRDEILVDIGGKMEAVVASGELADANLTRGQQISAVVVVAENAEGRPVISLARARAEIGWRDLQEAFERGEVLECEAVDHNKGGLIVSVQGVRGFVPLSQIVDLRRGGSEEQVEEKLRSMRGERLFLKIIEMNRRRNRLILSERQAAQERRAALKDRLLAELQAGEVRTGRVSSLTDFGAFVDLGGADGLVHLSELSWGQVQHPSQVLKVGQEIQVRVVGVDRDTKKIALSLKQVEENPWSRIEEKYRLGITVPARITKLAQFGAFAELEPGVEGLIHISELADERITHPKQVVREGETLQLKVIKIDSERHRVGLSLRQVEEGEDDYGAVESWGGGSYSYSGPEGADGEVAVPGAEAEPDQPVATDEPVAATDDISDAEPVVSQAASSGVVEDDRSSGTAEPAVGAESTPPDQETLSTEHAPREAAEPTEGSAPPSETSGIAPEGREARAGEPTAATGADAGARPDTSAGEQSIDSAAVAAHPEQSANGEGAVPVGAAGAEETTTGSSR